MCGILGFIGEHKINSSELSLMNDEMSHRGPDAHDIYLQHFGEFSLGFGHRRLSIIDLNPRSNQPMFDNEKKIMLVYNGEIYNYKKLKASIGERYEFKTDSDTEVILALYKLYGSNFVTKLHGIFSFAIFDFNQERLHLYRDRNGVKPMYYYKKANDFIFASELRPIMKAPNFDNSLDVEAIQLMLSLDYIPSPLSVFRYAKKLEPGCYLTYEHGKEVHIHRYWDVYKNYKSNINTENTIENLNSTLRDSIKNNLVADVPTSTFFSGGIDSTLVSVIADQMNNHIQTFTIGFTDQKYDESQYAQKLALNINLKNHTDIIKNELMVDIALKAHEIYDEPFGDKSLIPTYLVSKSVKDKGFKVVLSGDGGDEFFYGYNRYNTAAKLEKIYKFIYPIAFLANKFTRIFKTSFFNYVSYLFARESNFHYASYTGYTGWFAYKTMKNNHLPKFQNTKLAFLEHSKGLSQVTKMALSDQIMYLPDNILTKVDRASMANSVESRVPLLEHPLILKSYNFQENLQIDNFESKKILKSILKEYVPNYDFDKPKQGFSISKRAVLNDSLIRDKIYQFSTEKNLQSQNLFSHSKINKIISKFYTRNDKKTESFMWNYFMFQNWYHHYIQKLD